ncbi:MAG: hypothetical protein IJ214_09100 [Clostridia bacterium]|nr:hypothetical protein [Clostridia bacterium]
MGFLKRKKEREQTPENVKGGPAQQGPAVQEPVLEKTIEEKPDLIEYLQSLPEVENGFAPFEADEPIVLPEKTRCDEVADFIVRRTHTSQVTSLKLLRASFADMDELLPQLQEQYPDIQCIQGAKDKYYYSMDMTPSYAKIAMLIEEKDMPRTIAEMVYERSAYPAATAHAFFRRPPYNWTETQLEQAILQMKRSEQYRDIMTVYADNGEPYFYSQKFFSEKYGKALANFAEEDVE